MQRNKIPLILIAVLLLGIMIVLLSFALTKPCAHCGSDGLISCYVCGRKGHVDCETCRARGRLYCAGCNGSGYIKCADCNHVGYTEGSTCPECSGDGRCLTTLDLSDIGSSELLSSIYRNRRQEVFGWWSYTCNTCDGSGIERFDCKKCYDGEYECSDCQGTRFGDVCPDCDGTTQLSCLECNSTGYLECSACRGVGKQFIWE